MSTRKGEPTGDYLDPRSFGELLDLNRESVYRAVAMSFLTTLIPPHAWFSHEHDPTRVVVFSRP